MKSVCMYEFSFVFYSVPINGEYPDNTCTNRTSDDDLSMSGVLLPGMMEQKRRVGGGGQCFVPRCTNTRRHNPGLKWYRIPKVCCPELCYKGEPVLFLHGHHVICFVFRVIILMTILFFSRLHRPIIRGIASCFCSIGIGLSI